MASFGADITHPSAAAAVSADGCRRGIYRHTAAHSGSLVPGVVEELSEPELYLRTPWLFLRSPRPIEAGPSHRRHLAGQLANGARTAHTAHSRRPFMLIIHLYAASDSALLSLMTAGGARWRRKL